MTAGEPAREGSPRLTARGRLRALALCAPLLLVILAGVAAPLGRFLWEAVAEREVAAVLPRTAVALRAWDGRGLPEDSAFEALAQDLRNARWWEERAGEGRVARAGLRLEAEFPGLRAALPLTARRITETAVPPAAAVLLASPLWERPEGWAAIGRTADGVSLIRLLAALDLRRDPSGAIVPVPLEEARHRRAAARSLGRAVLVAALAVAAGLPLAWLIATAARRWAAPLLGIVTLAVLAGGALRGAAWWGLLRHGGPADGLLGATLGWLRTPEATMAGALHGAIPLAVLAMAPALRGTDAGVLRAARALGVPPGQALRRLVLPALGPGLALGAALAFLHALGDPLVPALLGGPREPGLAALIPFTAGRLGDPGLAAALSAVLLLPAALAAALGLRAARRLAPAA